MMGPYCTQPQVLSIGTEGSTEASHFREDGSRSRAKTVDIVNTKRLACWIRIVDCSEEWAFYSQVIIFIRAWSRRLKEIEPLLNQDALQEEHVACTQWNWIALNVRRPTPSWFSNSHSSLSLESKSWLSRECTCLYSSKFSEINLIELFRDKDRLPVT